MIGNITNLYTPDRSATIAYEIALKEQYGHDYADYRYNSMNHNEATLAAMKARNMTMQSGFRLESIVNDKINLSDRLTYTGIVANLKTPTTQEQPMSAIDRIREIKDANTLDDIMVDVHRHVPDVQSRANMEADTLTTIDDCHGWVDVFDMLEALENEDPETHNKLIEFWKSKCVPAIAENL